MRRRIVLQAMTAGTAALITGRSGVAGLSATGRDAEGPFYPVAPIPIRESLIANAEHRGHRLSFSGRVLRLNGSPVSGCKVEIWQCDANKVYHHPAVFDASKADPNFLGFGAQVSNDVGAYSFSTIVPVGYFGRPPHIHVKLWLNGTETLTTQVYLVGMGGAHSRQMAPRSDGDEFEAKFDFVIG